MVHSKRMSQKRAHNSLQFNAHLEKYGSPPKTQAMAAGLSSGFCCYLLCFFFCYFFFRLICDLCFSMVCISFISLNRELIKMRKKLDMSLKITRYNLFTTLNPILWEIPSICFYFSYHQNILVEKVTS